MAEQKVQITNQLNSKPALREVLDLLLEGAQIIDFNWRCVYVNDTLAQYEKTSREILLGQSMMERYPDIRQTDIFNSLQHCMTKREPQQIVTKQLFPDNSEKWFNLKIEPIDEGILILSSEITAQKESEQKINKIKHLYAFISQVNQNIVQIKNSEALFGNACRIAVEFGKFKMAWIGMFDATCTKITLVEQTGIPGEELGLFTEALFQTGGPQDYVLRTGKYYICNDIANDLELESWKPFAARHNIHSCMVLPISKSGKIIGTLNLYSTEIHFSNEEEIALLVEVTGDISFALDLFEKAKRHKETEELVIKNEKRFRALIEKSSDMKTLSNPKGRFVYCSPSVRKVLGYSLEEFLCKSDSDLIFPDDLPDFIKQRKELLESEGSSFNFQHRLVDSSGKLVWCEGTVTNMLHEPGVKALVSNFKDISENKLAEQQQEFDRNNLEALINNTNDLMWSVDKDFHLITSNRPFSAFMKLITKNEIVKGVDVLTTGISTDRLKQYKYSCERAFAGETFTEIVYKKPPFESWSEISYYPIRKGNEVIGTACHSRDITERKIQETTMKKQILLEVRNKELEQFAYLASHDLQEPLRTVSNYMQVFEEDYLGILDFRALEYLKAVNNATRRMSILIKSLLDFSKLGLNKKLTAVNFKDLIREVITDIEVLVETSNTVIEVTEMPTLIAYETEIRQLFQNLIINAIKFRRKDIQLKIKISSQKIKNKWKFSVSDNGIGIAACNFEKIFEIFQRLHTLEEYEGTGIGLANCKKIVELHQGEIWLESIPGQGSVFYFTI